MSNAEPPVLSDHDGTPPVSDPIVAVPDTGFRLKRLAIVLMLVGVGGWFCYDGFYAWPAQKRQAALDEAAQRVVQEKPHSDSDIFWNQVLGIALPPLGLIALAWFWYESRGCYRLDGQTLSIPGHPSIPLDSITLIDKSKWERKGVARLRYDPGNGVERSFKLDDFIYQRHPTDHILARIEQRMTELQQAEGAAAPTQA